MSRGKGVGSISRLILTRAFSEPCSSTTHCKKNKIFIENPLTNCQKCGIITIQGWGNDDTPQSIKKGIDTKWKNRKLTAEKYMA